MPEYPEVFNVCSDFMDYARNAAIKSIDVHNSALRVRVSDNLSDLAANSLIVDSDIRGKYMLITLSSEKLLLIHLGMSGSLRSLEYNESLRKHDHIIINLDNNRRVAFNDARRFGVFTVMSVKEAGEHQLLRYIGINPLDPDLNVDKLLSLLQKTKCDIKSFLLNARYIAGIGNIYASEILFACGIDPRRKTVEISAAEITKLFEAIKIVIDEAVKLGGCTWRNYKRFNGSDGGFMDRCKVYDRANMPCKICNNTITRLMFKGRSSFLCDRCQR